MLLEGDLPEVLQEKVDSTQSSTLWCLGTLLSLSLATMMEEACQQTTAERIAAEREMRRARQYMSMFPHLTIQKDSALTFAYSGVAETVLTFPKYLENAANAMTAKGASVVISSQTPNNPYETGTFIYSPSRFVEMAELAATNAGVDYVDHGRYTANAFEASGADIVNAYFPNDHTHTSPAGALAVADAFVRGVLCGDNALTQYVTNTDVAGSCI